MNTTKFYHYVLLLLVIFSSCHKDKNIDSPILLPDEIIVNDLGLYPEGIAYDEKEKVFYISSVAKGRISKVKLDGSFETFVDAPNLVSTLGMKIDPINNRLIVCVSDPGFGERSSSNTMAQLAAIAIYDISTANLLHFIPLSSGAPHLANDLVLDNVGNIYISDSFSPTIYKIDKNGLVSKLIEDPKFLPQPMNFGLNGLAFHPDGFLIVAKYDEGKLFKIPLSTPANFSEIHFTTDSIPAIDGILLTDNNTLVVASNNLGAGSHENAVYRLTSADNWNSMSIVNKTTTGSNSFPTTFTLAEGDLFVQYARLQVLVGGNTPPADNFPIVKVTF
ncbi:SMP-30/gluconolactonase/LRE family protein [Aureispira anguillae]|uniref:SMP-30/gluconolactonase/LRE family protein n=1 Tax=Aureispira anguillae TaxID=2864201 RepID=A0A916DWN8_9BACT|nr:SMP-30/gluconolactonase/LRE family protein [Aureispira anguillae]BDS15012.1 SMP-30/gluconolactonase/LRE family protein [Aureispira anguillae]